MFTGIVQGVAGVVGIRDDSGIRSLTIRCPKGFSEGLQLGASIAVDGVCLTVVDVSDSDILVFDVVQSSLSVTTLGSLVSDSHVNVERSVRQGDEMGGHVVSGHVDFCTKIMEVSRDAQNCTLRFRLPAVWSRYLFAKGYVTVNGVSLTVSSLDKEKGFFEVWLVPETRRRTTFEEKKVGDIVNIEIERTTQILVDTIRETLAESLNSFGMRGVFSSGNRVSS